MGFDFDSTDASVAEPEIQKCCVQSIPTVAVASAAPVTQLPAATTSQVSDQGGSSASLTEAQRGKLVEARAAQQVAIEAEKKGRLADALRDYVASLQAIPPGTASDLEFEIRQRVIKMVSDSGHSPPLPEDYRREMTIGVDLVKEATGPPDYRDALAHFRKAANAAPWAPQPYYNLGRLSKELSENASAVHYYKLFLMAAPHSSQASLIEAEIAKLQPGEAESTAVQLSK